MFHVTTVAFAFIISRPQRVWPSLALAPFASGDARSALRSTDCTIDDVVDAKSFTNHHWAEAYRRELEKAKTIILGWT